MTEENNIFLNWLFVEKHYPDYDHADEIAHNDDLLKLVEKEYEEGDCAHSLLMDEYGGDIDNPQIEIDFNKSTAEIYGIAITEFVKANLQTYQS